MDLYRKKVNFGVKPTSGQEERNEDPKIDPSKRLKRLYLHHLLKQNQTQIARNNNPNKTMTEDFLSDENSKKMPYKYGNLKNRNINSPDFKQQKHYDKSMSPMRRGQPKEENMRTSPVRKNLNLSREPYYSAVGKSYNAFEPKTKNKLKGKDYPPNFNNKNYRNTYNGDDEDYYDDNQNDIESSNYDNERIPPQALKTSRSPEPISLRNQFLKQADKPRYISRNKDIQAMPKQRKPLNTSYLNNNTNLNTDEEVDELFKTIDELQSIINKQKNQIRNLKKDNYNKDTKLNKLKEEVDDLHRELDDKRNENDKEKNWLHSKRRI